MRLTYPRLSAPPNPTSFSVLLRRYLTDAKDLKKYNQIVKEPVYVGAIVSRIIEGQYSATSQIKADFELMVDNCRKYWTAVGKRIRACDAM